MKDKGIAHPINQTNHKVIMTEIEITMLIWHVQKGKTEKKGKMHKGLRCWFKFSLEEKLRRTRLKQETIFQMERGN